MSDPTWWQKTCVYQIYLRSFQDGNRDGIGDLAGVLARLDYLAELGVETLWLTPFFRSPQRDFGYDISDPYAVDPQYGSLAELQRLLSAAHARGMRVILDMVLNHTSDEHAWFVQSRRSKDSPLRDYYLWRPGRRPGGAAPPNNWRSMIGPRGWHYDAATDEWYWASFLPFQPDLNYRNPQVKAAMLELCRYWLRLGFDGLRLDIFSALFKDAALRDNPFSPHLLPAEDNPDGFFQHNQYTIDQPDTLDFARELRAAVDEVAAQDGVPRFLVGEAFGPPAKLRRYCGPRADGLHLVFLFKTFRTRFAAPAFRALLREYEREFASPLLPTYVLGNHDRARYLERLGNDPQRAKLLATLQLTARGVPFIYYGECVGMTNLDIPPAAAKDAFAASSRRVPGWLARLARRHGLLLNRDECRGPMQWDDSPNAGFTAPGVTPWLPLHPSYRQVNVAAAQADPDSLWRCYQRLLRLRKQTPALHAGALLLWDEALLPPQVLGYRRSSSPPRAAAAAELTEDAAGTGDCVDVLLNFSAEEQAVELPQQPTAVLFSTHREAALGRRLRLRPYEGLIVRTGRAAPPISG
jgi:oligo-1,6-glucosidase/alpha-glucosidase